LPGTPDILSFSVLNLTPSIALILLSSSALAEKAPFTATNLWSAELAQHCKSSPAIDREGAVYVTGCRGGLFAFEPDGTRRWVFNSGFESVSTPAIGEDGSVVFGSRDHRVYAVSVSGRKKWEFKTGGWVDASPAIGADGTIYFGSWDKKFYAVSANGEKRWELITGGPVVSSAALDAGGNVYFGSHDRKFYAVKPDGSKSWEFNAGGPITSSPAIGVDGEIYFSSTDGKLHALNPDGSRRWELRTGGMTSSSPVLGLDGTIFISVNQTHCAVAPNGKLKWQRTFWHPQPDFFGESAAAVLADNSIVFTGGDSYVMTVPADNGDKEWLWNHWLFGPSYSSALVAPNGVIYAIGLFGRLDALQRDVPLAKSSWPTFRGNPQRTGRSLITAERRAAP
jgi:outer membrane protein assembly factor BamB